ncbi:P-loop containing nucleoside triphosphate hydrolase protein, partial [Eremomyces bilateralis CBS 781.70]
PLLIALTGLQGSGKSTIATHLTHALRTTHSLHAITVSLDDFYLPHSALVTLREQNTLYSVRGQPGTHDAKLAERFFAEVRTGKGVRVPEFDKSAFGGEGDRVPEGEWSVVEGRVDAVVFEGWCVGFRALAEGEVEARWRTAREARGHDHGHDHGGSAADGMRPVNTLADHSLEDLLQVNRCLERYTETFMGPRRLDVLVHLDTERLENVYTWRVEQEEKLREAKGRGMAEGEVVEFVRRYMPAYELYLDGLRKGFFEGVGRGKVQVRVLLGVD